MPLVAHYAIGFYQHFCGKEVLFASLYNAIVRLSLHEQSYTIVRNCYLRVFVCYICLASVQKFIKFIGRQNLECIDLIIYQEYVINIIIFQLLCDQFCILETMTPLDFLQFRFVVVHYLCIPGTIVYRRITTFSYSMLFKIQLMDIC